MFEAPQQCVIICPKRGLQSHSDRT